MARPPRTHGVTAVEDFDKLTPCEPVSFVSRSAPFLKIRLGQTRYRFENGSLILAYQEHIDEMRRALKSNKALGQHVRELNMDKAVEVAKQHQAMLANQRGTIAGGVDGESMRKVMQPTLDDRDNTLKAAGVDLDKFADQAAENDGMVMTVKEELPDKEAELEKARAFKAEQESKAGAEKEQNVATPAQAIGTFGNK